MIAVAVDASVAAKWFLNEPDAVAARALLAQAVRLGQRFVAPPNFRSELANAMLQRSRTNRADLRISASSAYQAIGLFGTLGVETLDTTELYTMGFQVAESYGLPSIYDALYVATARLAECELWTADQRLLRALDGRLSFVKALADFHPA